MNADVNTIVSGPRGADGITDPERLPAALVLELRRAGYRVSSDWLTGPNGRYQHKRVIRHRGAA